MTKILINYGRLQERDKNYGQPVECYVCDAPHRALGLARIDVGEPDTATVPLCEMCLRSDTDGDASLVFRKFLNNAAGCNHDVEITDRGEITAEQMAAMEENLGGTEH
jgi:hypothetical protein